MNNICSLLRTPRESRCYCLSTFDFVSDLLYNVIGNLHITSRFTMQAGPSNLRGFANYQLQHKTANDMLAAFLLFANLLTFM